MVIDRDAAGTVKVNAKARPMLFTLTMIASVSCRWDLSQSGGGETIQNAV